MSKKSCLSFSIDLLHKIGQDLLDIQYVLIATWVYPVLLIICLTQIIFLIIFLTQIISFRFACLPSITISTIQGRFYIFNILSK